jgi:type IV pilus assembly protein PilA
MIVVAVIAILASIALPIFQTYVARSQVTAAVADIEPGRSMIEVAIADAADPSLVDANYVGLADSTKRCTEITSSADASGVAQLSCKVAGGPLVNGRTLRLKRSVSGVWSCDASEFNSRFRPVACS